MNEDTRLYRQIHPSFIQQSRPTSQAFMPTRSDRKLSVYDGDQVTAEASFQHYTGAMGLESAGVGAVTVAECSGLQLPVIADGIPFPEHASVDFSALESWRQIATKAKLLRAAANARGWQFRP